MWPSRTRVETPKSQVAADHTSAASPGWRPGAERATISNPIKDIRRNTETIARAEIRRFWGRVSKCQKKRMLVEP